MVEVKVMLIVLFALLVAAGMENVYNYRTLIIWFHAELYSGEVRKHAANVLNFECSAGREGHQV